MLQEIDTQSTEMRSVISRLLGRGVTSIERVGGGQNSQFYLLSCRDSGQYAVKFYFRHRSEDRDRLGVEFSSLQFLWEKGVRSIPRPVAVDRDHGYGVYEYVVGKKITPQEVSNSDIDDAVRFLAELKELKEEKESGALPLASEACFSVQDIVKTIQFRLNRLSPLRNTDVQSNALREFLKEDFIPSFEEITRWCKSSLETSGMSFVSDLDLEQRTLSPSDFGFHNSLRRSDGQIVFLDFEYFGWDDPAKMISDFLLHPAMDLRRSLRQRFFTNIIGHFKNQKQLKRKIEIIYPLLGLNWCLILLNEFVHGHLVRRRFACKSSINRAKLQAEQLVKAKRMFKKVVSDYEHFPWDSQTSKAKLA